MQVRSQRIFLSESGTTLLELLIVVCIMGLLAAIAIPVFSQYARESRLSEAVGNLQGILESEQTYFVRFQRFTRALTACPRDLPPNGETQLWPEGGCDADWRMLGWSPEAPLYFRYRVFSHYTFDAGGEMVDLPAIAANLGGVDDRWGVAWGTEGFTAPPIQPWCAVEAEADTDADGNPVFIRINSFNQKTYRFPNLRDDGDETW